MVYLVPSLQVVIIVNPLQINANSSLELTTKIYLLSFLELEIAVDVAVISLRMVDVAFDSLKELALYVAVDLLHPLNVLRMEKLDLGIRIIRRSNIL